MTTASSSVFIFQCQYGLVDSQPVCSTLFCVENGTNLGAKRSQYVFDKLFECYFRKKVITFFQLYLVPKSILLCNEYLSISHFLWYDMILTCI